MPRRERQQCFTNAVDPMCIESKYTDFFNELFWHDTEKMMELLAMYEKRAMFISEIDGTIQYVNEKWCCICEFDKKSVIGQRFNILQGPKTDKIKTRNFVNTLSNAEKANMNIINYSKSGKELNLYVEAKKLSQNLCFGFVEKLVQ